MKRIPMVHLTLFCGSVFMLGTGCNPAPARSTLASLHRPACLGHPVIHDWARGAFGDGAVRSWYPPRGPQ